MARMGSDIAIEAADVALLGDNMKKSHILRNYLMPHYIIYISILL